MKVLLVNGSPDEHGCTNRGLKEVAKSLNADGVETEIFWIGKNVPGCLACDQCDDLDRCVYNDVVVRFAEKAKNADGFIFGSPRVLFGSQRESSFLHAKALLQPGKCARL
jgi:multimeric flavodoxin WrbA